MSDEAVNSLDAVHETIRRAILRGELRAGEVLSQVQLAKQIGVSRTPLREALRMLQREGLIEAEPNRAVRVAGFSLEDLDELYALRVTSEAMALRISAPLLQPEDVGMLEGALAQMTHFVAAEDYERWEVPHLAFHRGLVAYAGPRIRETLSNLSDHAERYRRFYTTQIALAPLAGHADHRAILDAIQAQDIDAAAVLLVQHLARTPLTVMAAVDPAFEARALPSALAQLTGAPTLPEPAVA